MYVTVKGAGHEVPTYKPYQAFLMFQDYLASPHNYTLVDPVVLPGGFVSG